MKLVETRGVANDLIDEVLIEREARGGIATMNCDKLVPGMMVSMTASMLMMLGMTYQ